MLRTILLAARRSRASAVHPSPQWPRTAASSTAPTTAHTTTRIEQPAEFRRQRNRRSNDASDNDDSRTTPFGWLMLSIPIATFGLGCWQVQRKQWKERLVLELATQTNKPAVDFPRESIEDLDHMEYQNVRVRGEFLHERELIMGPRSLIEKHDGGAEAKGGLITRQDSSIGFLVVTPFQVEGTGQIILVNRGWVPRKFVKTETRVAGNKLGATELVGVVRKAEGRPQFAPKSSSDQLLYRDIPHISRLTGALPYWLDADAASTVAGGPIGGQTRVTLRNDHLSYLVTWYSLSAVTAYLWYRQIYKGIPR